MTNPSKIYVGASSARPSRRTYSAVHEIGREGALRVLRGMSLDQVAGYLDGATAQRWDSVAPTNGIPDPVKEKAGIPASIGRLSAGELELIDKRTGLGNHYSYFFS